MMRLEGLFMDESHTAATPELVQGADSTTGSSEPVKRIVVQHSKWAADFEQRRKRKNGLNGKVVKYNMYENIIPFDEFEKLPLETKKEVVTEWGKRYTLNDIGAVWGKSKWKYSKYKQEFGLTNPTTTTGKKKGRTKKVADKKRVASNPETAKPASAQKAPASIEPQSAFRIKKTLCGKDLAKRLMDLAAYFDNDDLHYAVNLSITETEGEA